MASNLTNRAELNEKRQILAKLREELEFSRQNWQLVKQKTADSEREWKALRDEFAARRKENFGESVSRSLGHGQGAGGGGSGSISNSESGFGSDVPMSETEENSSADEVIINHNLQKRSLKCLHLKLCLYLTLDQVGAQSSPESSRKSTQVINPMPTTVEEETDEVGEEAVASVTSSPKEETVEETTETKLNKPPSETTIAPAPEPVEITHQAFIPPLEYLTHVPPELLPPLFPLEQDSLDDHDDDHDDDLPKEGIYQRLIASTTRSAMLANQLAEVNRTLGR